MKRIIITETKFEEECYNKCKQKYIGLENILLCVHNCLKHKYNKIDVWKI